MATPERARVPPDVQAVTSSSTGRWWLVVALGRDVLAASELEMLRNLRRRFARGGLPPFAKRSPEDDARIAAFKTISGLLWVLREYRDRVARGEAVRLEVSETVEPGRMRVEVVIRASVR